MQTITPLTVANFKGESVVVIGKVEIDIDGEGNYQTLPNVIDFGIDTNIEDEVSRFYAYSFNITCLNTNMRYFSWNTASNYYNWLKQGRRIKIYAGIKVSSTDYYYQCIIGRVDSYELSTVAGEEICTIEGRDFMRAILDYKLYSPNTYWGTTQTFNTIDGVADYAMHATCTGVYIAYLDSLTKDGTHLYPIYRDLDFGYVETTNLFSFFAGKIPDYAGTDNLKVYYYQVQNIEDIVGHILYLAGIFATTGARDTWLADTSYVTPTGKEIDRVWFNTGSSAFEAIRKLAEVAQYRFGPFDFAGNPIFKPKVSIGTSVDSFSDDCISEQESREDIDEVYNHIIVVGETRETLG